MTVYADILFLVDASMDFVALWLCARLLHRPVRTFRMCASACFGGVGSVAALVLPAYGLWTLLFGLALSAGMTGIAFGFQRGRLFITAWLTLWGTGALIGGVMTLLMRLGEPVYVSPGTYPAFCAATVGICALCLRLWRCKRDECTARLHIRHGDWQADVTALVDSGNLVVDPVSGTPVVFLTAAAAPDFPVLDIHHLDACPPSLTRAVRVVPTQTIHGERLLTGFLAEEVTVDGIARRAVIVVENSSGYGDCGALCPASLCGL